MPAKLTIKLDTAAAAQLRASILERTDLAVRPAVETRLDMILADERIDPLEAPQLFRELSQGMQPSAKDPLSLLAPDYARYTFVQDLLQTCAQEMERYIQLIQPYINEYHEDEESFFNYCSIENCFGLSYTLFNRTGSSYRMEAADRVLSDIQDMRAGLEFLQMSLAQGRLPEGNRLVRKFMDGPFGVLTNIRHVLSANWNDTTPTPEAAHDLTYKFAGSLVALSNRHEATELAIRSAFFMNGRLPDDDIFRLLPDMPTYAYEVAGRRITNSVFNLPSVAMMALTGPGRLLATVPKVRTAVQAATVAMGPARYILPGVSVYRLGNELTYVSRMHHLVANITFELAKGSVYAGVGRNIGGNTGATVALLSYMGGAWLRAGYTQQLSVTMSREIAAGETNGIVGNWIRQGMDYSDQLFLADDIAQVQFLRSFRLAPIGNSAENYHLISVIRGQLQTDAEMAALQAQEAAEATRKAAEAAKALATAMRRLDNPIIHARRLAAKLPVGKGDELLAAIQRIKDGTTTPSMVTEAKKTIEALVDAAKGATREAKKAAEAAQRAVAQIPTPRKSPTLQPPSSDSASNAPKDPLRPRHQRIADHAEEAAQQTPPEGTPNVQPQSPTPDPMRIPTSPNGSTALSAAEQLIQSPPRFFTQAVRDTITHGRISFADDALSEIEGTYQTVPELRGAILRRLNELSTMNGKTLNGWKKLRTTSRHCVNGRVGLYHRILAERLGDGKWKVYNFADRGDLDGGAWY